MKALYIVLPIVFFIALLLFSKVRFSFSYDRSIGLRISYLFVRIPIYPRNKKSKKHKNEKNENSPRPKDKHATVPPAEQKQKKKKRKRKAPLTLGDMRFLLRLTHDVISHILDRASRHVRIEVKKLRLSIGGSNDAARAAIEYGLVSQSVAYLLEFLGSTGFLKRPKKRAIDVGVNFLAEENDLTLRTDITCRLVFLIPFALSALTKALAAKSRWTHHRARAEKMLQDNNQQKKENDNG